ncbi:MAG: peptide-methionine (S)-S-oxide reductase MsrA [Candidatus Saccharimonadales bacterium]|nr:peptide-methionine (S)-S-oxide reductase MsrA [Candidatus Saccharimonadales bacterium]
MTENKEEAYLGGGCFWCLEAIYQRVKGVENVVSGFAGGHVGKVSWEQVHNQDTGHAEVVKITFDPSVISYEKILEIFWHIHDPTTRDRQGNDVGPQYRSIILTTSMDQARKAEFSMEKVAAELWDNPLTTETLPLDEFYEAGENHQNYYNNNPDRAYCQAVINPKLAKFEQDFASLLKD